MKRGEDEREAGERGLERGGERGVTPRRMSCSRRRMADSYAASTSETPAASALR